MLHIHTSQVVHFAFHGSSSCRPKPVKFLTTKPTKETFSFRHTFQASKPRYMD